MISFTRCRPSVTFTGLVTLVTACGTNPSDEVVIDTHRKILNAREQFDSSLSDSTSGLESDEARAEFQRELHVAFQKVADETTGSRREAALILQRHTDQLAAAKAKFNLAFRSALAESILDPAAMIMPEDYRLQRETLRKYLNESKVFGESIHELFQNTETELVGLPNDEWVTGILDGLKRSRIRLLPALESSCEAHQDYAERMLAIVDFLEARHGDWTLAGNEIQFSADDDLKRFANLCESLTDSETELHRNEEQLLEATKLRLDQ